MALRWRCTKQISVAQLRFLRYGYAIVLREGESREPASCQQRYESQETVQQNEIDEIHLPLTYDLCEVTKSNTAS